MSAPESPSLTDPQSGQPAQISSDRPQQYDSTEVWEREISTILQQTEEWLRAKELALPTDEEAARAAASPTPDQVECPLYRTHANIQSAFGLLLDSTHARSIHLRSVYKNQLNTLQDESHFASEQLNFCCNTHPKPWRHGIPADEDGEDSEVDSERSSDTDEAVDVSPGDVNSAILNLAVSAVAETKRPVSGLAPAVTKARELYGEAFGQLDILKTRLQKTLAKAAESYREPDGSEEPSGTSEPAKQDKLTHLHHSWMNIAADALTSVNGRCYFKRTADAITTQDQYKDQRGLDYTLHCAAHDGYARLTPGMLSRWREAEEDSLASVDSIIGHVKRRHDELKDEPVSERYYLLLRDKLSEYQPEEDDDSLRIEWRMFFDEGQAEYLAEEISKNDFSSIATQLKRGLKEYYRPHDD